MSTKCLAPAFAKAKAVSRPIPLPYDRSLSIVYVFEIM